jgi:hypothetical protein
MHLISKYVFCIYFSLHTYYLWVKSERVRFDALRCLHYRKTLPTYGWKLQEGLNLTLVLYRMIEQKSFIQ